MGTAYIHMPLNYTISSERRSCTLGSSDYQRFFSMWNLVFWSWVPSLCMLIFGLLTIRHVHQSKLRVIPQTNSQRNQKKVDRQLIHMLIIQAFVFGSTTTCFSIINLYNSITSNLMVKNDLQKARDTYLEFLASWLSITGPCISFYLFTLSSKLFRGELIILFCRQQPAQRHITIQRS